MPLLPTKHIINILEKDPVEGSSVIETAGKSPALKETKSCAWKQTLEVKVSHLESDWNDLLLSGEQSLST